jgi:hypothetical protein
VMLKLGRVIGVAFTSSDAFDKRFVPTYRAASPLKRNNRSSDKSFMSILSCPVARALPANTVLARADEVIE